MTGEWVWSSEEDEGESTDSDGESRPMNKIDNASSGSDRELDESSEGASIGDVPPVNLVLRMRNAKRELNDIRFEFAVGKDSADGIAAELVGAGLVDSRDIEAIASNLHKLIESQGAIKIVTFPLVSASKFWRNSNFNKMFVVVFQSSGLASNETPDDKALIGFAQISITD